MIFVINKLGLGWDVAASVWIASLVHLDWRLVVTRFASGMARLNLHATLIWVRIQVLKSIFVKIDRSSARQMQRSLLKSVISGRVRAICWEVVQGWFLSWIELPEVLVVTLLISHLTVFHLLFSQGLLHDYSGFLIVVLFELVLLLEDNEWLGSFGVVACSRV